MPHLRTRSSSRTPSASRMKAPPHPFPELQGPFEESMTELERVEEHEVPSDAASRRTILLDAPTYERVIAGRWRQRPGERYHPLWKIVAQLSFGIHLLAENLAKSEEEVMQILQGHIDEIDLFLERTTEDFALAQDDIKERMRCLQLPLQHPTVFDRMLEERTFRNSIVEGNEKIEHIVARTGCAMKDSLKDAQKGLDATSALEQYLASLEDSWGRRSAEHEAVFEAMLENVEGWRSAFVDLHTQGDALGQLLKQLTEIVNQMQQRAGEVSRRLIRAQQTLGHDRTNSNAITYITPQNARGSTMPERPKRKPLPVVPNRESTQSSNPSLRCPTAQSVRSTTSLLSSDVYRSRTSSRERSNPPGRDSSAQTRLSTRSPRLIEIRRPSPNNLDRSVRSPSVQSEMLHPDRTSSRIAELPAEMPNMANRHASFSPTNVTNTGLGIIQDETSSQSARDLYSPPLASGGSFDPSVGLSRLPMTPNSMSSNGDSGRAGIYELSSGHDVHHTSIPSTASSKPAVESSMGSPPSTPGWAKQTFDASERERAITDKTAFRSHPPNADLGSPPVIQHPRFQAQAQHGRLTGSVASSLGAPGPEIPSSERGSSIRSGSVGTGSVRSSAAGIVQPPATAPEVISPSNNDSAKSFIAELEGTTPFLLTSAVYTKEPTKPTPRQQPVEAVELEAPHEQLTRLPTVGEETSPGENYEVQFDQVSSPENSGPSATNSDGIEGKVAAAVRRSFIATNIELPGSYVGDIRRTSIAVTEKKTDSNPPTGGWKVSTKALDDILAQLEQLSTQSPNLSLKGEETLFTLPATTYKADNSKAVSRPPAPPAIPTVGNNAANQSSPSGAWSDSSTSRSKSEKSSRTSIDSSVSSQSQWKAFFKGQLSPAEFTPHLPGKGNSTHKSIVELQRRGQEASPTLGWQWAPESPELERRTYRK